MWSVVCRLPFVVCRLSFVDRGPWSVVCGLWSSSASRREDNDCNSLLQSIFIINKFNIAILRMANTGEC